jgi:glucokinase
MHILFDIGGTVMRVAALRGEHFETPVKVKTPAEDIHESIRLFIASARELAGSETIESASGGIAGIFDRSRQQLVGAPHLPGFVGFSFGAMLGEALGTSVFLENDAMVVGLGEAVAGAGRGASLVAYVTVSTGIGGARISAGNIERGVFGFEPGHQIVSLGANGATSNEILGLEDQISGTAFLRRYGKPAYQITKNEAWEEAAYLLAVGLHNLTLFWSPEVIVLGGSMMVGVNGPTIPLESVQHHFEKVLRIFPERPVLRLAELGDDGGLHGAEALVKARTASRL